jgi:glycine/D-amino acid oxidase-like deaminating enzyme
LAADLDQHLRALSLWWDCLPGPIAVRPALAANLDVDIAIVGAGFTGLWTAYYLLRAAPGTRVALLEKEVAGYGASGRNGGWCSALFPVSGSRLARDHGAGAAKAMLAELRASVDEVGRVAVAEGIECSYAKCGTVVVARNAAQATRAQANVASYRDLGVGEDDLRWLSAEEARALVRVEGMVGATYTPHCAALDPVRLVRGLAEAVERQGASLYEKTPVELLRPAGASGGRPALRTAEGFSVRADVVVRAVEGWTPTLPGEQRSLLPVYSLMVATEPLPTTTWEAVGLKKRETFSDWRHLVIYGQRTRDGRLAFGGRGAPYHFASAVRPSYDRVASVHRALEQELVKLFPALRGTAFTHSWGGPLGVPRDWSPSVGLDKASGLAWAGGYVGDGVAASNLAGRTLAALVLGEENDICGLPWVGHRSPKWEPEPLRWAGVNAALLATKWADKAEALGRRPSWLAGRLERLFGS